MTDAVMIEVATHTETVAIIIFSPSRSAHSVTGATTWKKRRGELRRSIRSGYRRWGATTTCDHTTSHHSTTYENTTAEKFPFFFFLPGKQGECKTCPPLPLFNTHSSHTTRGEENDSPGKRRAPFFLSFLLLCFSAKQKELPGVVGWSPFPSPPLLPSPSLPD